MISVNEALRILQENIPQPRIIKIPLNRAYGRYLGKDIIAPEPSPRYTNSAMDGYAVRWQDCAEATTSSPVTLDIIGESQAGIPFDNTLTPGAAVRISTGAMLPAGADTVIRIEDTSEVEKQVTIRATPTMGLDVRHAGEEFTEGAPLFQKHQRLGTRELALLAAVGINQVPVYDQPSVSLLVTGTELAQPYDSEVLPHQIRDSNTIMLESGVRESGAMLSLSTQVEDNLDSTIAAIRAAIQRNDDVILCSGGVSVGRHDHVKEAALQAGFQELFWKIRQKPGKPLFVGKRENTLLFGLPGNPVSAFMCFNNYVKPALAKLQGTDSAASSITAKIIEKVTNTGKRTHFIRVKVEENPSEIAIIKEMAQQGSHMLSTIVHADGYIVLQPEETLEPGSLTEVFLF